ncbi:putative nuclease HARBI1 [Schistocerca serialis cubense]|uniref:putative nuclease HARBI1 n=1 Tax=Schistocerca serialis cubense TaxID=2023355 RepID=UPI00214F2EDD|nr:putative nuclease HARBI1 [Schistocerca serialis cubense]
MMFVWDWDCNYPSSDDDFEENLLQMLSDSDYSVSSDDEFEETPVQMSSGSGYIPSSHNQSEATLVQRTEREKEDDDFSQSKGTLAQNSKRQKEEDFLVQSEATSVQRSKRQKKDDYFDLVVPQYSDAVFLEHFRVRRHIAEYIAEKYRNSAYYNHQAGGNGKLIPLQQILIFLWFAGHETDTFRNVSERFSISASTLCNIVKRVSHFISNEYVGVIKWPSAAEKAGIESCFRSNGLPGVIGAIGGTHIKIDKPQSDPYSYLNTKRFYSIQLQIVSDHELRIRDIFVGYPGSVDDETVFRKSPLFRKLGEICSELCIVGDVAYPCLKHLLTPYRNTGHLTRQQNDFNLVLSRSTSVVEHCFRVLKERFKQLFYIKLRNIEDIVHFIRACCILHNIALKDTFVFEGNEGEHDKDATGEEESADLDIRHDELGAEKRDTIAAQLLISYEEESDDLNIGNDKLGLENRDRIATQLLIQAEGEAVVPDDGGLEERDTIAAQLLL